MIAIAGILLESNTFITTKTTRADFSVTRGDEIPRHWGESRHEVGGFLEGARHAGLDIRPLLVAAATPSGAVTDDALDRLTAELTDALQTASGLEGVLLALHGAMVAESYPDADAEVVRRVRAAIGRDLPLVVTHDFHANIGQDIVDRSTALLTYQTNPHVDQRARGARAAALMADILAGRVRPVQALAKPPMLYNIRFQNTSREPLAPVVEESRRLEQRPGILAASVAGGYQYADVEAVGPSVVVVADRDRALAAREAQRLSEMLWATRDCLVLDLPDAAQAVAQAVAGDAFPVVLVEMGDNIGGGSAGDATFILEELVRQQARGWMVAIADPEVACQAAALGVGAPIEAHVGGKTDALHGSPVPLRGRVKSLHDGRYIETEIRHGGQRYLDQGLTAVIEAQGSTPDLPNLLLATSKRHPPFSLHQLISCGVYPERQRILVVKAAVAFRAAYEPVARRIIEVDTPGTTAVNPARFTWKRARRPLFGLDEGR